MTPLTAASRLLEPLSQPWAVLPGALVPWTTTVGEGIQSILELAVRLLHLLLAL